MANAGMRMQAYVALTVDMKLLYDCPSMSGESFEADAFFRKYGGKTATIVSFPTEPVGPLDKLGRLPGLYLKPKSINVRFEGEETVHRLNLNHFVLLDSATTLSSEEYRASQRVGDLAHPILFYQGDTVYKTSDLLQEPRRIVDVRFAKDGTLHYLLAETPEARGRRDSERADERRKAQDEADKNPARTHFPVFSILPDFPRTETCKSEDLTLVNRGKVFSLYCEPEIFFDSPEEERAFWSQDGISTPFYGNDRALPALAWSLEYAIKKIESGEADIIALTAKVFRQGKNRYQPRRLHDCFSKHRERVRQLPPPVEEEV